VAHGVCGCKCVSDSINSRENRAHIGRWRAIEAPRPRRAVASRAICRGDGLTAKMQSDLNSMAAILVELLQKQP
jgi:hypothetical protein